MAKTDFPMIGRLVSLEELDQDWKRLVAASKEVREFSHSPYSHFRVGSALLDDTGKIHSGCNVENASYSVVICAERSAIVKMVSEGGKRIQRFALVTNAEEPCFPCGVCLQAIIEFGPQCQILAMDNRATRGRLVELREIFPAGFTEEMLNS